MSTPITELSEARCWELLRARTVGRLAVGGLHPDIFPVNYRTCENRVIIRTGEGQKLVSAAGHNVAFEVDALDDATKTGWSVVVRGIAEEPRLIEEYLSAEDLHIDPWAQGQKSRFVIITPSRVTGREIPRPA